MFGLIRRALLAAVFVWSAINAIQNAEHMTGPADALGLPEPERMVKVHGWVNLVGGIMLALNVKPKLAALAMVANLIPTTAGGHQFWEADDEGEKINQMVHFFKNVSLLGGLLGVLASPRSSDDA
ncbi:MAG TPA: DoxX family protein [Euzebyales bacterium]|nr:DoxX family protein [Euzebyales bacterium]